MHFSVELFSFCGIDMRKDKINRILRKTVERTSFGNDIPEERMIVFNMRLLIARRKSETKILYGCIRIITPLFPVLSLYKSQLR